MEKSYDRDEYRDKKDEDVLLASFGNPSLFEIIVERYEKAFIRRASSVLGNRETVEDIVQDTFVKIYVHGKKFCRREGAQFSSWAYKILMNTCFSWIKKMKRERKFFVSFDDELEAITPDESTLPASSRFNTDYLISLFTRLPDTLARVLYLYVAEGKTYKTIAEDEATSENAIKVRMYRVKHELKKLASEIPY